MKNCYNTGTISCLDINVPRGGIVGELREESTINYCYNLETACNKLYGWHYEAEVLPAGTVTNSSQLTEEVMKQGEDVEGSLVNKLNNYLPTLKSLYPNYVFYNWKIDPNINNGFPHLDFTSSV